MDDVWMRCSACKRDLHFGQTFWACSVSTCNRNRTRLVFCSVPCWDSHVATLRHREAWSVESRAPTREEWEREAAPDDTAPVRRVVAPAVATPAPSGEAEREMLIVISKLKKYIRDRSGMNCSDAVADILSDHVRAICDDAIRSAGGEGRKTVLDRDVPRPRR